MKSWQCSSYIQDMFSFLTSLTVFTKCQSLSAPAYYGSKNCSSKWRISLISLLVTGVLIITLKMTHPWLYTLIEGNATPGEWDL